MRTRREVLSSIAAAPLLRAAQTPARPNILFILMDDLRWDELRCAGHPCAQPPNTDPIPAQAARCHNASVPPPLCSPSRASFLTGLYAHTHGIVDNTERGPQSFRLATFPPLLHSAGYETGFIGKFHMGNDDSPRPGFDYWVSFKGQGTYHDPELNENGKPVKTSGYTTDILSARAAEFLERKRTRPFFLWLAHKAAHPELTQYTAGSVSDPNGGIFIPAERHKAPDAGLAVPRRA